MNALINLLVKRFGTDIGVSLSSGKLSSLCGQIIGKEYYQANSPQESALVKLVLQKRKHSVYPNVSR
jgi:hypothetical protein